jgi:hypothetical protein
MAIRNLVEVWTHSIRDKVPADREDLQDKLNAFHAGLSKHGCADQVFEIYQYFSDARSFDTRIAAQAADGGYKIHVQLFCLDLAVLLDDNTFALAAMHEITHAWVDLPEIYEYIFTVHNWKQFSYSTLAKLFKALPFSSDFLYLFRKYTYIRHKRNPGPLENKGLRNLILTSEHLFKKGWELVDALSEGKFIDTDTPSFPDMPPGGLRELVEELSWQKKIAAELPQYSSLPQVGYTNTMDYIASLRSRHKRNWIQARRYYCDPETWFSEERNE